MLGNILKKGASAINTLKRGIDGVKRGRKEALEISENSPLEVEGIKVYPNRLKYKYKNSYCSFYDIEHIKWHWESVTTNGIVNKQITKMTLYIRNDENIFIKSTSMYSSPKLVIAYNHIAKETFDNRLKFYTDQLEKTGSFIYKTNTLFGDSHTIFYTNGKVKSGDKTFELSKAYIEAFELTIKQGGMFSSKLTVNLDIDKDIIMALINFILENPQEPSDYINNYKEQNNTKKTSHP